MHSSIAAAAAVALVVFGAAPLARGDTAASPPSSTRDAAGLHAIDREYVRILVERDAAAHRELVHPNFLLTGGTGGVLRRRQAVDRFALDHDLDRFERSVEAVTITGDVGIVTGTELVSATDGVESEPDPARSVVERRFTNVYLYAEGRWRLLARQVTPVATFAPPRAALDLGPAPAR